MISIKIILANRKLANNTSPVVLRIIKDRKSREIPLPFRCKKDEFENQEFSRNVDNFRKKNRYLLEVRQKANKIIDDLLLKKDDFTLDEFVAIFKGNKTNKVPTVYEFFNEIIEENLKSGRTGNARAYQETRDSLFKFASKELKFREITAAFLDKYVVFMKGRGNMNGGISFKLREIRAIFNKAIQREIIDKSMYPFLSFKISKIKKESNKRALSIQDFKKIKEFNISLYPKLRNSHNYFLFSFYTRGMNFVDMMKLKWSDITNGKIIYIRSKTKTKFIIEILPIVQEILDYYKELNPNSIYVFPIMLNPSPSPMYIENRKKKILQRFNSDLKIIAAKVGVTTKVTSYVARHSFSMTLKELGVQTDLISQSLGHSNLQITQTYLKDFGVDVIDEANKKLLDI